jgi:hypothetical protein
MKNDNLHKEIIGERGTTFLWISLAIAAMLLPVATAIAEIAVRQFVTEDFNGDGDSAGWASRDGRSTLASEHAATNGWSLATQDEGIVCFGSSTAPLAFPDSATGRVTRAIAVVVCEEAAGHATLFDASCSVRFMPRPFQRRNGLFTNPNSPTPWHCPSTPPPRTFCHTLQVFS